MNITQSKPYQYTTLKGILPYAYGDYTPRVLISRALYVLNGTKPNQDLIIQRSTKWVDTNKRAIIKAWKDKKTHTVIVNLPFQTMLLSDAIKQKYIKIKKIEFQTAPTDKNTSDLKIILCLSKTNYINTNSFAKDFAREIALTLSVGLIKTLFDTLKLGFSFQMALLCAFILGIVKGTVKSATDILASKKGTIANMPLKCAVEVLAEIATAIVRQISGFEWHPALKSALKGFFKYIFKHVALGITILMTKTELSFEMFKAAVKGFLRACCRAALINLMPPVGQILGPMFGSILGALLINLFIDQCSLAT